MAEAVDQLVGGLGGLEIDEPEVNDDVEMIDVDEDLPKRMCNPLGPRRHDERHKDVSSNVQYYLEGAKARHLPDYEQNFEKAQKAAKASWGEVRVVLDFFIVVFTFPQADIHPVPPSPLLHS